MTADIDIDTIDTQELCDLYFKEYQLMCILGGKLPEERDNFAAFERERTGTELAAWSKQGDFVAKKVCLAGDRHVINLARDTLPKIHLLLDIKSRHNKTAVANAAHILENLLRIQPKKKDTELEKLKTDLTFGVEQLIERWNTRQALREIVDPDHWVERIIILLLFVVAIASQYFGWTTYVPAPEHVFAAAAFIGILNLKYLRLQQLDSQIILVIQMILLVALSLVIEGKRVILN